jgi:ABC-2 type transport system ATP-binding protein
MIVETRALQKAFGRVPAISDLSLRVPTGSVFALIGANGAGKSTTLRLMMNILKPDAGEARVLGIDSTALGPADFQQIGYVSESQRLPERLSVAQYFDYLRCLYRTWDRALERELLQQFALPPGHKLKHLSHGMRMKALLIGALAFRPKLLVLDEPLSGLDPLVRDEVVSGLLQQAEDTTVLISSHELTEIESFTTHVAFMQSGRLLLQEEIEALRARFQSVTVRLSAVKQLPTPLPPHWLLPEIAGHQLQFITDAYEDDQQLQESLARHFGAVTVHVESMSLRSIANTLLQDHKRSSTPQMPVAT